MKKVGEILREERLRQSKTLKEISQLTNVREDFLDAIEKGDYKKLPSNIYIRGFVSSYSKALNMEGSSIMPFYRREFEPEKDSDVKKIPIPIGIERFRLTPGRVFVLLGSVALTIFLVVLFVQYRSFAGIPVLVINTPTENLSTTEEIIDISGKTDPKATITINGEPANVEITGSFKITYQLNEGINRIKIIAESDLGKQNTIERIIEKKAEDIQ